MCTLLVPLHMGRKKCLLLLFFFLPCFLPLNCLMLHYVLLHIESRGRFSAVYWGGKYAAEKNAFFFQPILGVFSAYRLADLSIRGNTLRVGV